MRLGVGGLVDRIFAWSVLYSGLRSRDGGARERLGVGIGMCLFLLFGFISFSHILRS